MKFLSVLLEKNPKEVILDFKMSKKWPKKPKLAINRISKYKSLIILLYFLLHTENQI
jgi:hypothetical protein